MSVVTGIAGLRSLWRTYLKREITFRLYLGATLFVVAEVAMLLAPVVIKFIVDDALAEQSTRLLVFYVAVGVSLHTVGVLSRFTSRIVLQREEERISKTLRLHLLARVQQLNQHFVERYRSGELATRIYWSAYHLGVLVGGFLPGVLQLVVTLVGTAFVLGFLDLRLALIALVPLPFLLLIAFVMKRRLTHVVERKVGVEESLFGTYVEAVEAIFRVFAPVAPDFFASRVRRWTDEHESLNNRLVVEEGRVRLIVGLAVMLTLFSVLAAGGYFAISDSVEVGTVVVFYVCIARALGPLRSAAGLVQQWQRITSLADHLSVVVSSDELLVGGSVAESADEGVAISFENVGFGYDQHAALYEGFSFEVRAGERVAILGPSGAGKSTLLKLLTRGCEPESGHVRLFGVDVQDLTLGCLRSWVGVVPQDVFLFSGSVQDNIFMGTRPQSDVTLVDLGKRCGLASFFDMRGSDFEVGPNGGRLSGGEMRRIALARALLRQPPILLFDQFASDLEDDCNREIFAGLREDPRLTVLYVGHRIPPGFEPDAVFWIEGGRLVRRLDD